MDETQRSAVSQRQHEMARLVIAEGQMSIAELAERLEVSQMTAYRHAAKLVETGLVRRVRGGVTPQPSSISESSLEYRWHVYRAEKQALSDACLQLVEPGMSVVIDDGTTLQPLVSRLHERTPLTVMTTFLPAITQLRQVHDINLIVVGGAYRRHYDSLGGVLAADMVSQLRADLLFFCPSAISDGVALHQEEDMVAVKRAMIASSARRVLVADHSKLGRRATHRLASLEEFELVLTDDGASPDELAHVLGRGIPVTKVSVQR